MNPTTATSTTTMMNGVNVRQFFDTMDAVRADSTLARCFFRARNRWVDGGHNQNTIRDYYCAGQELSRAESFVINADEPPVLLGLDRGANPVEIALAALASCLTSSLIYHAAAKGIEIEEVESQLEGFLDLQGFMGLSDQVRNGYQTIQIHFQIKAAAPEETLRELCELAQKRSPVFDIVSNPVPVTVTMEKKQTVPGA